MRPRKGERNVKATQFQPGVQSTSGTGIAEAGAVWQNGYAERLIRTIKGEEVKAEKRRVERVLEEGDLFREGAEMLNPLVFQQSPAKPLLGDVLKMFK